MAGDSGSLRSAHRFTTPDRWLPAENRRCPHSVSSSLNSDDACTSARGGEAPPALPPLAVYRHFQPVADFGRATLATPLRPDK